MSINTEIRCPKCNSNQITANKKGFSGKKAVGGVLLTGGIGLLAGTIGSNSVVITCLSCGKKFKPGEGKIVSIENTLDSNAVTVHDFSAKKPIDMTPDEYKAYTYQFHKWKSDFYDAHNTNDVPKMDLLLDEVENLRTKYDFKDILDLEILKKKVKDENYYPNIYQSLKGNEIVSTSGVANLIIFIIFIIFMVIIFKSCT